MPITDSGKAIASRNATTHGVFARDIVLPALGEDPGGYQQVQDELVVQLRPGNLLERHYVEKIAAASWRLRRLHRWQAQLFEDDTLTEDTRLDKLDKVLRHETALQRQIDTAVKMLARDVPQLYNRRIREQVLEDTQLSERECLGDSEMDMGVAMEVRNRQYRLRKATAQAVNELSVAPIDTVSEEAHTDNSEICQNEPAVIPKRTYRTFVRADVPVRINPVPPKLGARGPLRIGPEMGVLPAKAGSCFLKHGGSAPCIPVQTQETLDPAPN